VIIGEESDDSIPLADEVETSSEVAESAVAPDRGGPGPATSQEIPEARPVTQGPPIKRKDTKGRSGPGSTGRVLELPVVTATVITERSDAKGKRKRDLDRLAQERRDPKGAADLQRDDRAQRRRTEEVLDLTQQQSVGAKKASDHEEVDSESEKRRLRGREFLPQD
jgi:hypothetical protein